MSEPMAEPAHEAVDEEEAIMAASRVVARHRSQLRGDAEATAAVLPSLIAEVRAEHDPSSGKSMAGLSDEDVRGAIACVLVWQQLLPEEQVDAAVGREPLTLYRSPLASVIDEDGMIVPTTAAPHFMQLEKTTGSGPILKKNLGERVVNHSNRIHWDEPNLEYNEAHKDATMIIDEPPTPFNYDFMDADEDENTEDGPGSPMLTTSASFAPSVGSQPFAAEDLMAAFEKKKHTFVQGVSSPSAENDAGVELAAPAPAPRNAASFGGFAIVGAGDAMDDDDMTERQRELELARKAKFKEDRKKHYKMDEAERMRELLAKAALEDAEADDDDDDDGDGDNCDNQ